MYKYIKHSLIFATLIATQGLTFANDLPTLKLVTADLQACETAMNQSVVFKSVRVTPNMNRAMHDASQLAKLTPAEKTSFDRVDKTGAIFDQCGKGLGLANSKITPWLEKFGANADSVPKETLDAVKAFMEAHAKANSAMIEASKLEHVKTLFLHRITSSMEKAK
jgi:hypothetical protein